MINTPGKFLISNLFLIEKKSWTDYRKQHLVYSLFYRGNNISTSSPFNAAVTLDFWYLKGNIYSLMFIKSLVFRKMMSPKFQIPCYTPMFCFPFVYRDFLWNQLPVKYNQIHQFVTVCTTKCIPPETGG